MPETLTTVQYIFWGTAIASSVFFVLQTILTLAGIGGDSADFDSVDSDTGIDHHSVGSEAMQMFTIRNFVNFFLGFGWTGVCLEDQVPDNMLRTLLAVAVGIGFVALFMFIFSKMLKLEHSGNINIDKDVIGREADVYLHIPAGGIGKIQVSVNGTISEYDATATEDFPTGSRVRITARHGINTVVVTQLSS